MLAFQDTCASAVAQSSTTDTPVGTQGTAKERELFLFVDFTEKKL